MTPEDRDFLTATLAKLQAAYNSLEFVLPPGVIHGDASVGNVLRDTRGNPVLIDLDGFAIGPREWDLALTAIYYDSFGWHTAKSTRTSRACTATTSCNGPVTRSCASRSRCRQR